VIYYFKRKHQQQNVHHKTYLLKIHKLVKKGGKFQLKHSQAVYVLYETQGCNVGEK